MYKRQLLENIRIGRLNATDEEVLEAARKAQCMEFLEKLPQGIHSMAGDAGKMLSGGQRQRISLARAILKEDVYKRQASNLPKSPVSYLIVFFTPESAGPFLSKVTFIQQCAHKSQNTTLKVIKKICLTGKQEEEGGFHRIKRKTG